MSLTFKGALKSQRISEQEMQPLTAAGEGRGLSAALRGAASSTGPAPSPLTCVVQRRPATAVSHVHGAGGLRERAWIMAGAGTDKRAAHRTAAPRRGGRAEQDCPEPHGARQSWEPPGCPKPPRRVWGWRGHLAGAAECGTSLPPCPWYLQQLADALRVAVLGRQVQGGVTWGQGDKGTGGRVRRQTRGWGQRGGTDGQARRKTTGLGLNRNKMSPTAPAGTAGVPRESWGSLHPAWPSPPSPPSPQPQHRAEGAEGAEGPEGVPGVRGGCALTRAVLGHGIHAVGQHSFQAVHVPPHGSQVEPAAGHGAVRPKSNPNRPKSLLPALGAPVPYADLPSESSLVGTRPLRTSRDVTLPASL